MDWSARADLHVEIGLKRHSDWSSRIERIDWIDGITESCAKSHALRCVHPKHSSAIWTAFDMLCAAKLSWLGRVFSRPRPITRESTKSRASCQHALTTTQSLMKERMNTIGQTSNDDGHLICSGNQWPTIANDLVPGLRVVGFVYACTEGLNSS